MSEHTSTHDAPSADRPFPALSPSVRSIAFEAVPPRDRSLAATLCTVAGEAAVAVQVVGETETEAEAEIETESAVGTDPESDTGTEIEGTPDPTPAASADVALDTVANAVTILDGYARIRRDLLADRYDDPDDRDAAILASDHLHASAYAMLSKAPVSDRQAIDLYRVVCEGSSTLATRFMAWADSTTAPTTEGADTPPVEPDGPTSDPNDRQRPSATLGGIATTLGATAVGATSETRSALESYGQSLSAALAARPSADDPFDTGTAIQVLSGRPVEDVTDVDVAAGADADTNRDTDANTNVETGHVETELAVEDGDGTGRSHRTPTADVDRHLERARDALAVLEAQLPASTGNSTRPPRPSADGDRSPTQRLERATRIPFRHEHER